MGLNPTPTSMSKEQTALERIKNEVAKENGYFDYDQMVEIRKPTKDTYDGIFDIICERYARECCQATLEKAAGNVKVTIIPPERWGENQIHSIDKSSITNPENICIL